MTYKHFAKKLIQKVKQNFIGDVELDYAEPYTECPFDTQPYDIEHFFSIIPMVDYGCEGIYLDVCIQFDDRIGDGNRMVKLCVFKTLDASDLSMRQMFALAAEAKIQGEALKNELYWLFYDSKKAQ